jgi:hypothetical protein
MARMKTAVLCNLGDVNDVASYCYAWVFDRGRFCCVFHDVFIGAVKTPFLCSAFCKYSRGATVTET